MEIQKAGDNSQQIQIQNLTIGIDEKRAREIYDEKYNIAKNSFTEEAIKILSTCPKIVLNYDSLNIEKHSHTIFEGYYRGLLGLKNYINKE